MLSKHRNQALVGTALRSTNSLFRFCLGALALFVGLIGLGSAQAQGYPVKVSVTVVSESPAELRIEWDYENFFGTPTERRIFRREKGDTPWGSAFATLNNAENTLSYSDTGVVVGQAYEYKVETLLNGSNFPTSTGYVSGGIRIPMPESRGKLLLLVDASQASALAPELRQLEQDLTGDGWTVLRTDMPRSVVDPATAYTPQVGAARLAEVMAVKNVITTAYNADPTNVKSVYIIGHVAPPYSGVLMPDGHFDHSGAWPADTFYADVNGTWTDSTATSFGATDPRNVNVPGDGKFDQASIPSDLELQVGRVDFKNMTLFPSTAVSETELLRRYLRKAHDYRKKQGAYAAIERRAIVINAFGPSSGSPSMTTSIGGLLGRDPALVDVPTGPRSPWFAWMEANPSKTYLIGSAQTAGGADGNGAGSSYDFGLRPSRSVFNVLFGSYLGDWGYTNNFMRASLAGNATGDSLGLTCFWGGRPNLYMQSMGLGETIGYSARVSQNSNNTLYASQMGHRGIHTVLMGDPALRLYSVQPPQNLQAGSSSGSVALSWDATTESDLLGYLVYRGTSAAGPFTKLTASPIAQTTYTDSTAAVGTVYTYLVKTLKLETTPSGTFENPSSASVATITASGAATSIPPAPTNLQVAAPNSTNINLTWNDATGETSYRVERRSTPSGSFSTLTTLAADTTAYTDAGPLTVGATFYYRVIAVGSAGDSLPSQEVAVSGQAGSIKFDRDIPRLSRAAGYVDVPVRRIGGSTGTVTVNFATEAGATDSARPGVDYTATSGTLTFADGETLKTARVHLLKPSPQPLHMFTMRLSAPTGGAQLINHQLTYAGAFATVLVEDPAAPVTSPWQTTVIGGSFDPGSVGQVGSDLSSVFWGGTWNINATEDGRFIHRTVTGDKVMTMRINAPSVETAALMVRATAANNFCRMVAVRFTNGGTSSAQFWARSTEAWPWNIVTLPTTPSPTQVPYWARITRSGDTFIGEVSPDGNSWTVLGSASVPGLPTTAEWGFFQGVGLYQGPQRAEITNISITDSTAPSAPGSLAAARTSTGGSVTWVNTSSNASGVRLERRLMPSGSFAQVASLAAGVTTYADNSALPNETYEYRILAFNDLGDSSYSATATLGPLAAPVAPTNFTAAGASLGSVALAWQSGSLSTAGYTIERRAEGTAEFVQIGSTTSLTFTDSTAAPDTGYTYRILANNSVGSSTFTTSNAIATPNIQPIPITTATGQGADAHTSQVTPDVNFGSAESWIVEDQGFGSSRQFTDTFMRFDLTSVSTSNQWLLVDVELEATLAETIPTEDVESGVEIGFIAYLVFNTAPAWSESTITWNNAPWRSSPSSSFTGGSNGLLLGEMVMLTSSEDVPAGTVATLQIWSASWKTTLLNTITTALADSDKKVEFYFNQPNFSQAVMASAENPTYDPPKLTLKFQKLTPNRATNLDGAVTGLGSISLTWADTATDETGYRVEASTNGGASYTTVATLGANATTISTSSIPPVAGNHLYRVVAFNAHGDATPSLTVTLAPGVAPTPPPTITTSSLPAGNQSNVYSQTLSATGGSGSLTWTISSGNLPAGLTLSSGGVISGTPSGTGTSSFTVRVTDSAGTSGFQAFSLTVHPPVATDAIYYDGTGGRTNLNGTFTASTTITADLGAHSWVDPNTAAAGTNVTYIGGTIQVSGYDVGSWNDPDISIGLSTDEQIQYVGGTWAARLNIHPSGGNWRALGYFSSHNDIQAANSTFDFVIKISDAGYNTSSVAVFLGSNAAAAAEGTPDYVLSGPGNIFSGNPPHASVVNGFRLQVNYSGNAILTTSNMFSATEWTPVGASAPLTGIAAWFDSYGLPTDGTGDGAPDASLAGDGIKNLMKYALGIDPEVSGYQGHYSTGTTTVGDSEYLSLTYTRPEPAPEGVTYIPQACDDLSSWSGNGIVEISSTVSDGLRIITVRDGTAIDDASRRFLRLMVTTP